MRNSYYNLILTKKHLRMICLANTMTLMTLIEAKNIYVYEYQLNHGITLSFTLV